MFPSHLYCAQRSWETGAEKKGVRGGGRTWRCWEVRKGAGFCWDPQGREHDDPRGWVEWFCHLEDYVHNQVHIQVHILPGRCRGKGSPSLGFTHGL